MTDGSHHPNPDSYREADDATARMTLDQIKARPSNFDRRRIEATTEENIARHMVEDGELPPTPEPAGKEAKR